MLEWYEADNPRAGATPKCCECGETITSEYRYHIDGSYYCEDCMDLFREVNEPMEEEYDGEL